MARSFGKWASHTKAVDWNGWSCHTADMVHHGRRRRRGCMRSRTWSDTESHPCVDLDSRSCSHFCAVSSFHSFGALAIQGAGRTASKHSLLHSRGELFLFSRRRCQGGSLHRAELSVPPVLLPAPPSRLRRLTPIPKRSGPTGMTRISLRFFLSWAKEEAHANIGVARVKRGGLRG